MHGRRSVDERAGGLVGFETHGRANPKVTGSRARRGRVAVRFATLLELTAGTTRRRAAAHRLTRAPTPKTHVGHEPTVVTDRFRVGF